MSNEKFLPVGSVVLLKGANHKLMIIGFCTTIAENDRRIFDYVGCYFPEGVLTLDKVVGFNHNDIKEVFFKGFYNEESKKFHTQIHEFQKNFVDENGILKMEAVEKLNKFLKKEAEQK